MEKLDIITLCVTGGKIYTLDVHIYVSRRFMYAFGNAQSRICTHLFKWIDDVEIISVIPFGEAHSHFTLPLYSVT